MRTSRARASEDRALSRKAKGAAGSNPWFRLRRSKIAGVGAFALVDIPKGTRLIEYTGERVSNAEADRRYPDEDHTFPHHTFLFILNSRTLIDAGHGGNEARFINHSCEPNCDISIERGHIWVEAVADIPKGTELTYDYEFDHLPEYTEKDLRFHACLCGSRRCRRTIVKLDRRRRVTKRWEAEHRSKSGKGQTRRRKSASG